MFKCFIVLKEVFKKRGKNVKLNQEKSETNLEAFILKNEYKKIGRNKKTKQKKTKDSLGIQFQKQ